MSPSLWRWKTRLAKAAVAVALAVAGALLAFGLSVFLTSFSSHDQDQYEPKDIQREIYLEQKD